MLPFSKQTWQVGIHNALSMLGDLVVGRKEKKRKEKGRKFWTIGSHLNPNKFGKYPTVREREICNIYTLFKRQQNLVKKSACNERLELRRNVCV